jgi:hypothetical protein
MPTPSLHTPPRQPIRSQGGGLALMILSPILGLLVFGLVLLITDIFSFILLGGIFAAVGAGWGFDLGRRMRLPDGWEVLKSDRRPPVIYLRPFFEDARQVYDAPVGARHGGVGTSASARRSASHEREIAKILGRIGPLIAIGKPGDRVAPHGFARVYVGDDVWQQAVLDLIKRSAIVILQPEATDGTWWELQTVAATTDWRRLLMIVPDPTLRPLGYGRIRSLTGRTLPVPLPETPNKCDAFMFDASGKPLPILLSANPALALHAFVEQVRRLEAARMAPPPTVAA